LPTADPRDDALDGFTGADVRVSVDAAGVTVKFSQGPGSDRLKMGLSRLFERHRCGVACQQVPFRSV